MKHDLELTIKDLLKTKSPGFRVVEESEINNLSMRNLNSKR